MNQKNNYKYDVVLSFAGEDRQYVDKVAQYLSNKRIRVFYDKYEQGSLWGKNLYEHLDDIYRNKGRYCVMFLSKNYADKLWTDHERKSAQTRAFKERREYILPARFDDTAIAGILPTVGYIDLRTTCPDKLGELILQKLGEGIVKEPADKSVRKPHIKKTASFNPYEEAQKFIDFIVSGIKNRCASVEDNLSASVFDREGHKCIRIVYNGKTKYSLDVWMGGISGDSSISFYGVEGEANSFSAGSTNAWASIVFNQKLNSMALKLQDMSLLETLSGREKEFTYEEFLDALWDRICNAIESDK